MSKFCDFPEKRCSNMDKQDNSCLLRNRWDCPYRMSENIREGIERASKIAQENMKQAIKEMSGARLQDWIRFWQSKIFTPNKLKGGK